MSVWNDSASMNKGKLGDITTKGWIVALGCFLLCYYEQRLEFKDSLKTAGVDQVYKKNRVS